MTVIVYMFIHPGDSVSFCFFYFELLCPVGNRFLSYCGMLFFIVGVFFTLTSKLSDVNIATPPFFALMFTW